MKRNRGMMRVMILLGAAGCLFACGEERRVVRDGSANAKFAALLGGSSESGGEASSGGWHISRGGTQTQNANQPVSDQARRIAEIIRNQRNNPRPAAVADNPSNLRVITSFQETPLRKPQTGATTAQASDGVTPPPTPWGAVPVAPAP